MKNPMNSGGLALPSLHIRTYECLWCATVFVAGEILAPTSLDSVHLKHFGLKLFQTDFNHLEKWFSLTSYTTTSTC